MAVIVDFEQIDRGVLGFQAAKPGERLFPCFNSLMRQACDQVEADIGDSGVVECFQVPAHRSGAMRPADGAQLMLDKRLNAHTDAVNAAGPPRACQLGIESARSSLKCYFSIRRNIKGFPYL